MKDDGRKELEIVEVAYHFLPILPRSGAPGGIARLIKKHPNLEPVQAG